MSYRLGLDLCSDTSVEDLYQNHWIKYNSSQESSNVDVYCPEDITVPANASGFKIDLKIKVSMYIEGELEKVDSLEEDKMTKQLYRQGCMIEQHPDLNRTTLRFCNPSILIAKQNTRVLTISVDNTGNDPVFLKRGQNLAQIRDLNYRIPRVTTYEKW